MRSLTVRSLLSVAVVAAFAPMPAAAQFGTPQCNMGDAFNPMWVACQGAWYQTGTPSTTEFLALLQEYENWEDYWGSSDFQEAWLQVEAWEYPKDHQGKTDFAPAMTDGAFLGSGGVFANYGPGTEAEGLEDYMWVLRFRSPLTFSGVFALLLKGGNYHSIYLFNLAAPVSSIALDMRGTWTGGGTGLAEDPLSHVDMFGGTTSTVPEPSSLLLLGSGLLGLGFVGYRRRRK